MKTTDKFVLFWGGPFSQWYEYDMVIHGVTYNCAEQFMMAMKARFFGDFEAHKKIMATGEPSRQKSLGRTVKNFDVARWDAVSRRFVFIANYVKFQNPLLRAVLMDTGDREIVEASPYDRIWGIGLGVEDPRALDKSLWQGKNWLGQVLVDVRTRLRELGPL